MRACVSLKRKPAWCPWAASEPPPHPEWEVWTPESLAGEHLQSWVCRALARPDRPGPTPAGTPAAPAPGVRASQDGDSQGSC